MSKVKVIVHSCLIAIRPCAKFGMHISKSKDDLAQTQIRGDKYNFDIEVKGQGHTEVMNVCDTLSHGDTLV